MDKRLDNPNDYDNRMYDYSGQDMYTRAEYPIIEQWIPEGSSVIDLGCGNGSLMHYLVQRKNVHIEGIEKSDSGVDACVDKGFRVRKADIDRVDTYRDIRDKQFDVAVCNVTIQMVMFPEVLFREMRRIAKYQIISFPNFAYISNRIDMALRGRMPRPMLHGYTWYNTGHLHQLSIKDFEALCDEEHVVIKQRIHLGSTRFLARMSGNLFSKASVFMLI